MDNLRLIIRKLIEEIEDEEIEEATVTGDVAGYNTPMAFTGGKGKGKKGKIVNFG